MVAEKHDFKGVFVTQRRGKLPRGGVFRLNGQYFSISKEKPIQFPANYERDY